jgi:hypothetical protein
LIANGDDCNDASPNIHPGATETCNGLDDNCNGVVDEGGNLLCDDGNACTVDSCDPVVGCVHVGGDTLPPAVTCPAPITKEFTDSAGAVVTFTTSATDPCVGPLPSTDSPHSGSIFPIGTTTVTSTATDQGGLTGSCQFSVTVLGSLGVQQDVLADLHALRDTVSSREDRHKLDQAIDDLSGSLALELWVDQTHVRTRHGEQVFEAAKKSIEDLAALQRHSKSHISEAILQGFIDRLVRAERELAFAAIQDASSSGGDRRELGRANQELAHGDWAAAQGKASEAVGSYREAWKHATKALQTP